MKLTAAVAQTASVLLDTPATVERALALMAQAAAQGLHPVAQGRDIGEGLPSPRGDEPGPARAAVGGVPMRMASRERKMRPPSIGNAGIRLKTTRPMFVATNTGR